MLLACSFVITLLANFNFSSRFLNVDESPVENVEDQKCTRKEKSRSPRKKNQLRKSSSSFQSANLLVDPHGDLLWRHSRPCNPGVFFFLFHFLISLFFIPKWAINCHWKRAVSTRHSTICVSLEVVKTFSCYDRNWSRTLQGCFS